MDRLIWIKDSVFDFMIEEASKHYPQETGGILLGYKGKNGEMVVTDIIGPGPDAKHSSYGFCPDHDYQMAALDEKFKKSDGMYDYLGDWHTHPGCANFMSLKDRRTLARIARSTMPRLCDPCMIIVGQGDSSDWSAAAYRLEEFRFGKMLPRIRLLQIRIF